MMDELSTMNFPTARKMESSAAVLREIRVAGSSMSDIDDMEDGHLYIVGYGQDENEDLGESVECVVLRQAMKTTGEWNNSDPSNKHYMYNSSEFMEWGDVVVLYDTHAIPTKIVAALPYSHRNPDLPAIGGKSPKALKTKCNLRLRYVFYVLYNGEVFRMNGGSTDYTGADENDKPMGFNMPDEGSFLDFLTDCGDDPIYGFTTTLAGSKHSKKIFPKKFKKGKALTEAKQKEVFGHMTDLYQNLEEAHSHRFNKAMEEGTDHLDEWSKKIVDIIQDKSFDQLLKGSGSSMFKDSTDSLPDVIDVKLVGEAEQNVGGIADALSGDKVKASDLPF